MDESRPAIQRQRTALHRRDHSLPVKCAMRDGLIAPELSVFDYGCGHGTGWKTCVRAPEFPWHLRL